MHLILWSTGRLSLQGFSGLGEEGWRLARADNGFWCFMRAKDTK